MIKEFKVDKDKFEELYNNQYKKHPKWQKTAWIRKIINIITVMGAAVILIYGGIATSKSSTGFSFEKYVIPYIASATSLCLCGVLIQTYYTVLLKAQCSVLVNLKFNESLILRTDYFENGYKPGWEGTKLTYDLIQVRYDEISRLVYNKYYDRLNLYGKISESRYSNYERGDREYSFKEESEILFYLYYENSQEFLKILSEKSGINIETIDYVEE